MQIEAFPLERLPELWAWLGQFPENNFDDAGPRSLEEFEAEMRRRLASGQWLLGVAADGRLVGAIGFECLAPYLGMFRGIVFDRSVHGAGIAAQAVRAVLERAFRTGIEKVSALYFADNKRIDGLLIKLGAIDEGLLRKHTRRNGQPVDVRVGAFFKEDF